MTANSALIWKEWRQARPYLLIGLGVFVCLPLVAGIEQRFLTSRPRLEFIAYPWLTILGGSFAVLTGVGVVTPDLRPRLQEFWTSRPVRVWWWGAVKFLAGLATVLICSVLPLVIDATARRSADAQSRTALQSVPFLMAALYSLSFACGCLIRRPAHAATVAFAVMLLVYLAPLVLPPLGWLNVADLDAARLNHGTEMPDRFRDWWRAPQLHFAAGMSTLAAAAATVAVMALVRGWQVESGQKLIYGAVSAGVILLTGSAAYQLGTNLPVLQAVDLPQNESVRDIYYRAGRSHSVGYRATTQPIVRSIDVMPTSITVSPPVPTIEVAGWQYWWGAYSAEADRSLWIYGEPDHPEQPELNKQYTLSLRGYDITSGQPLQGVRLWREGEGRYASLLLSGDRAYALGTRLVTIDNRPGKPLAVLTDQPYDGPLPTRLNDAGRPETLVIPLVRIPGLPPAERLRLSLPPTQFDGSRLALFYADTLSAYQMTDLTDRSATLQLCGEWTPSYLQRLTTRSHFWQYQCVNLNGLVYARDAAVSGNVNAGISVYDIRTPGPIKRVGHFAAPGADTFAALPDGRTLVGGTKIWLLGPPR